MTSERDQCQEREEHKSKQLAQLLASKAQNKLWKGKQESQGPDYKGNGFGKRPMGENQEAKRTQ